ncbi:uncharacterized protein C8A04DRAFT_9477 [Dichotomopilus funicola]|uniref:Cyclin N-terminal domain-containing protein n=1 Tax=Dichotomopilus funicola TaxID=1934379 RepID=A0AAN6V8H7_9PEZI|nr:hypothetical protein C8A04DRAFT_9477 [Dichotomopilus funicola]
MATQSPDYSDDEYEFDEEYFSRTYQPLSNLPTPPPSSREANNGSNSRTLLEDGGLLDSALLGPAIHLVNLIPPAASLSAPSVALVHEMLVRAELPTDIVALAVCILDSLSSKFALNWRLACPLAQHEPTSGSTKRHTIQASSFPTAQLHIDSVNPEVIVLGALVIAFKFQDDKYERTQYYRTEWGKSLWTCGQLNVTERCIMADLGYRILPLWHPALIADAISDMRRAARQAVTPSTSRNGDAHKRSASSGDALTRHCYPLTPAETPVSEDGPANNPMREAVGVVAFGNSGAVDAPVLHAPPPSRRKTSSPVAG